MSGVKTEIWTGELVKSLSQKGKDDFLSKIPDYSRYAKNDTIHLTDVGAEPEVLVNNTTYPISNVSRKDEDIAISLDKFDSKNTKVTDDELYAIAYDKIRDVQKDHVSAIHKKQVEKFIHALGAKKHSRDTPVIKTSGAKANGLSTISLKDIIALKAKFDELEVDDEGRVLVLSSSHLNQLLELDQKFANQYYHFQTAKLLPRLYGFEVHSYVATPYYHSNGTTGKLSFGSVVTGDYCRGSVAYYAPYCFKAKGSLRMYYKDAKTNPEYRESVVGFRTRGIVLPKKERYIGAIISVK